MFYILHNVLVSVWINKNIHGIFQGAGHNDVELHNVYLERLKQFVTTELLNWHLISKTDADTSNGQSPTMVTNGSATEKLLW